MNKIIAILLTLMAGVMPTRAFTADAITEAYVVEKLYGHYRPATEVLPSFVIPLRFPHDGSSIAERTEFTTSRDIGGEALHNKLFPLGKALASDALQGFRLAISVRPSQSASTGEGDRIALLLAQAVQSYLVDHFSIKPERLLIVPGENSTTAGSVASSLTSESWLIEIRRLP